MGLPDLTLLFVCCNLRELAAGGEEPVMSRDLCKLATGALAPQLKMEKSKIIAAA